MTKKILLIITGSIAAYKAVELIRLLQKKTYEVEVVLTKAAQEFITPLLVSSIAKNKIHTELFADDEDGMAHINLSRRADLIVVAPASADFLAKMAGGFGDDLASTTILAADKKIVLAPAMNEKMWFYAPNLQNVEKLKKSGVIFVEPKKDELACGEIGVGKMAEPAEILACIEEFFACQNLLRGKKIIITGGATHEPIDAVRFIGNASSGKQAIYLAQIFSEMGADVEFIAGAVNLAIPLADEKITRVKTADEMFAAVQQKLQESDLAQTCFISCAAVADFKVKNVFAGKIKKQDELSLELVKNVDILQEIGNSKTLRPRLVVGFAAENEKLVEYAREKLQRKNCDLVVANLVRDGAVFGSEESEACLVMKEGVGEGFGEGVRPHAGSDPATMRPARPAGSDPERGLTPSQQIPKKHLAKQIALEVARMFNS